MCRQVEANWWGKEGVVLHSVVPTAFAPFVVVSMADTKSRFLGI